MQDTLTSFHHRPGTIGAWTRANAAALAYAPDDRVYWRQAAADTTIYHCGALEVIVWTRRGRTSYWTRRTGHFHADHRAYIRDTYAVR